MCFAVVLTAVVPAWALGTTFNVPGDFATIQACIDAAQDGDECVVALGTYHELIDFLGKAITLRSSDGPEVTIIDAGPVADPGRGRPVVRCDTGEGPDTVLEGFTITGGTGNTVGFGTSVGGGVFNNGSSPTVTGCVFSGNMAGGGGGMFNNNASPTVTDCIFTENMAISSNGGGMSNLGGSSPTVTNCVFIENAAASGGGGMYNFSLSNPTVTDCTFSRNSGVNGGGMYNRVYSSPTVTDCAFSNNTAPSGDGGGMANERSSNPTVTDCTFSGNSGFNGGGMYNLFNSNPTVTNCMFSDNTAGSLGGGMHNFSLSNPTVINCTFKRNLATDYGGGMYNVGSAPTLDNCTFSENSAIVSGRGGGLYNINSSPTVTDCTFSGNSASGFDSRGGGMYNQRGSSPTVTNCTFSGNTAGNGGGMFSTNDEVPGGASTTPALKNCVFWDNAPDSIVDTFGAVTTVSYSNVQGMWPGTGNIDTDPLFLDPNGADNTVGTEDDNLRLLPGSPCINTGDSALIPGRTATDLDGHARVLCTRVDMGAYEFGIGDFNCDQIVTLTDFADWDGCMTGPDVQSISPSCEAFDFEFDGDVDLIDWAGFQNAFTEP